MRWPTDIREAWSATGVVTLAWLWFLLVHLLFVTVGMSGEYFPAESTLWTYCGPRDFLSLLRFRLMTIDPVDWLEWAFQVAGTLIATGGAMAVVRIWRERIRHARFALVGSAAVSVLLVGWLGLWGWPFLGELSISDQLARGKFAMIVGPGEKLHYAPLGPDFWVPYLYVFVAVVVVTGYASVTLWRRRRELSA